MGYLYGPGGGVLCDRCGTGSRVRKRRCPHKVTAGGQTLPYCSPPALCSACFREEGGSKGVHGRCKAASNAITS